MSAQTANRARSHENPRSPGSRRKDHAIMGTILAGASIAWFGWGQQGERLVPVLVVGSVAGLVALVAGIVLIRRAPGAPTMSVDPAARRIYWVTVAAEVVACLVGSWVLGLTGHGDARPALILAIVGVHFVPLARAFAAPVLRVAAFGTVAVAALAALSGAAGALPTATVAGGLGGLTLLLSGLWCYRIARADG